MKFAKGLFFSAVFFFACCCAKAQEVSPVVSFAAEAVSFRLPNISDNVRTDIYIAVPYSFLFFQNAVDRYIADYRITLEIRDSSTNSLILTQQAENSVSLNTTVWEKLKELDQTRADASQISVHLAAGRSYKLSIRVHDRTKNVNAEKIFFYRTRSFSAAGIKMSDILLYRSKSGNRLIPNIGSDIGPITTEEGGVFFELYDAPQSSPMWVVNLVTDSTGADVSRVASIVVPDGRAKLGVFTQLMDDDIWSGSYELHTILIAQSADTSLPLDAMMKKAIISASRHIEISYGHGVPLVTNDLDEAIEQLLLISYGGAYDSLSSASSPAEKRKAIKDYWQKMNYYRDQVTTRPMDVFYRRVRYANEHYGQQIAGWKTDRGKIYIMFGEPTSVERAAYDVGQRPYESWTYYDLNRRYIFVDQFLIGDYRLSGPPPPPGTFEWERDTN